MNIRKLTTTLGLLLAATALPSAAHPSTTAVPLPSGHQVGVSLWGPNDEIGRLNLVTDASRAAVL